MAILPVYSGRDLNGSFTHPLIAPISLSALSAEGIAQITVRMTTNHSILQLGMDGAVVPSVAPGEQGEIEIQVWQTSSIHREFLLWYNLIKAASDAGDVSNWFGGSLLLANTVDGSSHYATGVGPTKVGDKTYAEQAGRVTWLLMAANIANQ